MVLLGTVFPLVVEALDGERLTVGAPYFDRMTMPIGLALLFLMAVAPVLPWRKASARAAVASACSGRRGPAPAPWSLAVVLGARGLAPLVAFGLGGFAAGAAVRQVVLATRRQGWRGLVGRTNGGMVVHLGVVMIAVALAASGRYDTERELTLSPGETAPGRRPRDHLRGPADGRGSTVTAEVAIDGAPRVRVDGHVGLAGHRHASVDRLPATSTWRCCGRQSRSAARPDPDGRASVLTCRRLLRGAHRRRRGAPPSRRSSG